jgi:hypothetical protein
MMIILAVVYGVASQFQVPEWVLQFTFYAFMTAMFGFVFGVLLLLVRDHLNERKVKKARKLKVLKALKEEYSRCKWSIENNIEKYIAKNEMTDFVARLVNTIDMGEMRVSEELQREIQKYNEKIRDYNLFRKTSDSYIRNSIEHKSMNMFKKTLMKNNEWNAILWSDFFMAKYFNGESVTCNWLSDNEPLVLRNITKEIDESERHELDILFKELNDIFQKEEILVRFRKQKEAVIEQGKEIIKNLEKEISSLDKQLQKHEYLEAIEDSSISPFKQP